MSDFLPDRSNVVLRHILERQAREQPQKECIVFDDGERWTYERAVSEAYRSSNQFAGLGIQRGENVLIFMPNGREWIRAWWGISFLGGVIVPVNTAYKGEMLRHVCQDSQARYIVSAGPLTDRVQALDLDLEIIDPMILAEGSDGETPLDKPLEPWETHAILYTSGTTGPSKGVIAPHFQVLMTGIYLLERATSEDTLLVFFPLFHMGGLHMCLCLWQLGGRVALQPVLSASRLLDMIRDTGTTVVGMTREMAAFIYAQPPKPDDADNPLRLACISPVPENCKDFMARFGIKEWFCGFNMTETSMPIMTRGEITNTRTCGKVRPGVEARLVDAQDIPVPVGQQGELILRTDRPWEMNAGYWNRPEETARSWRNGWFHTGDMFICDEEGDYYFVDRKKDAIRRRGENISSFEVEREVLAYPGVLEVACIGAPSEFGDEEVKVFVAPREGASIDPADLIQFLIPRMPYFMVPRFVELVPDLPKTPTMRVKKYELRSLGNTANTWDREAAGIKVTRHS
jgi:carnitine-CoA ligase